MSVPRLAARLALAPAALAAVAALTVPASAATAPALVSASAVSASAVSASAVSASTGARPAAGVIVIKTTVPGLVIRSRPSTSAARVLRLGAAGTRISVNCWTLGTTVAKNSVWYHTVSPKRGYVASVFTSPRKDPVAGLPRCPFRRTYLTKVAGLVIRSGPSTRFKAVGRIALKGSRVVVSCWTRGQSVRGDNVWYGTVSPFRGFAAGAFLNTGRDPAAGVPHC
jgi:hypothetical protein